MGEKKEKKKDKKEKKDKEKEKEEKATVRSAPDGSDNYFEHRQHNLKKFIVVMFLSVWNLQHRLIHRIAHCNTRSPCFLF